MLRSIAGLCALVLAGLAPLAAAAQAPARPPAIAYARLPAIETAVLSPNGSHLAYIGGSAEDRVIFITPIDAGEPLTIRPGAVNVKGLRWAGNGHLLVTIHMFEVLPGPGPKIGYTFQRDLIVDVAAGRVTGQLLREVGVSRLALGLPVLAVVDGDKPSAIVQGLSLAADAGGGGIGSYIPKKGDDVVPALWRVDLASGRYRMVERGARLTWGYDTDLAGDARLRWDYDGVSDRVTLLGRRKGSSAWKTIDSWSSGDAKADYLGYSDPDDAVIARVIDGSGSKIVRISLADGQRTEIGPQQPAPDVDVAWDPYRNAPIALVSGEERQAYQWLDTDLGAIHGRMVKAFKGREVSLQSWSADRGRIVIAVDGPDAPPAWYLYDVKSRQVSAIAESYPELAGVAHGRTQWISYPARDGLKIPAYLTLPPPRADGAKPPLIVLPHGGPAARDHLGFDWIVQFLTSRGYAVLQPQFRGSAGFGDAFERAGRGEWGGKMQTDLDDGVKAVAAYGVDSSRACIMGLSYGGYAALAGAVFRPNTYRCAISVNGDSDLGLTIGSTRRAFGETSSIVDYWRTSIGDPRISSDALTAASPARRIGGASSPILLFHSELDTIVPIEQGRAMERAMNSVGQAQGLIVFEGDDHYLSKTKSRLRLLQETEAFLAKHLPLAP